MAKKIIWTHKVNLEPKELLAYWIQHNQSKAYSIKLNKLIIETLRSLAHRPEAGRKTEIENVRVKIIRDYLLFYEVDGNNLVVLTLWDGRRSETSLVIK